MLTLNDGRTELWQWDTNRKLTVDADCSQVHFSNKVFGRSIDVDVVDGVATIPDILLQTDKELNVWAFVGTAENGYTKISKTFKVNRRNKPADYVFTPSDQTTLSELEKRIESLEENQDPDAIKNAVNDYLEQHPLEESDPTVSDWAKQPTKPKYTASEVGALPDTTNIPTSLPNPHALTINGTSYDGSEAVDVTVEGGDEWDYEATIEIEEEVHSVTINADENGDALRLKEAHVFAWVRISGVSSNIGMRFRCVTDPYVLPNYIDLRSGYGSADKIYCMDRHVKINEFGFAVTDSIYAVNLDEYVNYTQGMSGNIHRSIFPVHYNAIPLYSRVTAIDEISIVTAQSDAMFSAGIIKIVGRRA